MTDIQNHYVGIWHFSDTLSQTKLKHFATRWVKDSHYLHLYVRRVSPDRLGLGFIYQPDQSNSYEAFFQQTFDALKQEFGDSFVGWDISSTALLIK